MKKVILYVLSFICLTFLISCSLNKNAKKSSKDTNISTQNKQFSNDAKAKYNLYLGLYGNVGYIQIKDIKENSIDYGKPYIFNFKKEGLIVSAIANINNKVFASIHEDIHNKNNDGKKVVVMNRNNIISKVEFPNHFGMSKIIIDKQHHKGYVMCAVQPSNYNPKGTPFVTFNTQNGHRLKTIHLKGILGGYSIKGNYIYMAVFGAKKTGYSDVPDQYIARLDRDSGKVEVVAATNKNQPNLSVRDFTVGTNKMYLLTGSSNDGGTLSVYNLDGTLVKNIPLENTPAHLALNKKGILYISHVGSDYHGQEVTLYNTKTGQIIKNIKGFDGAGMMQIQDNYLFVDNEGHASVTVVDMKKNQIIGTVDLGLTFGSHGLVVSKN